MSVVIYVYHHTCLLSYMSIFYYSSPDTDSNDVIYVVTTRDDDVIAPFNEVTLSIEPGFGRSHELFTINQRGEVRVGGAISDDVSRLTVVYCYNNLWDNIHPILSVKDTLI